MAVLACGQNSTSASPSPPPKSPAFSPTPAATASPVPVAAWPAFLGGPDRRGVSNASLGAGSVRTYWSAPLDAAEYGQPLVARGQVFAATENNSVYALDAASGVVAWKQHLGDPVAGRSLPCGNIDPSGITSTPVIDPAVATLYTVAFLQPAHHELFALDLATGAIRWHRAIDPPGADPRVHQQRGALTFSRGRVYVPYGGLYGDCGAYHGWVVASPADGEGPLLSYRVQSGREAGIWAPGGATTDSDGNLFVSVGNGSSTQAFDYGNSVIKLSSDLHELGYWAPADWSALNAADTDVGSISPAVLDEGRLFQTGKSGIGYLVNRDRMGNIGGEIFSARVCPQGAFGATSYSSPLVYVPCGGAGIAAVRILSGRFEVSWRGAQGGGNTPVLAGGSLWTIGGSQPAQLVQADPSTGEVRSRTSLVRAARFASVAAGEGKIFVPAWDQLIAVGPG